MEYIGEHILPGLIGRSSIFLGVFSAAVAAVLYLLAARKKEPASSNLRNFARISFIIHGSAILLSVIIMYFLIFSHYFEYAYVWKYSSISLRVQYIISCFWAGQEGSLLIWTLFQSMIGIVLLVVAKNWEDHVMSIFSVSQVFMTSMLVGISFGSFRIGLNPFELLRNTITEPGGTIFHQADYLNFLKDGNGLNPLLENIWMTIHPPVLFLGYALALVPFSYLIASLVRKNFFGWIKPSLPWIILSLTVLGAGILLGGAWAYVSLTFGGFWSWDPVENSSLVPWLTLVAGLHFLLISKKQNNALFGGYLFIGLSYVLILYASFLTRSGVLASTSAHSFSDNGMTGQLMIFFMIFLIVLLVMTAINRKGIRVRREEIFLSRELWMFVGAIVIVLSAFQILFTTSVPVINLLLDTRLAPPNDQVKFYNTWQLPFALLITGFIAFSQFLYYGNNSVKDFFRKIMIPAIVSVLASGLMVITGILNFPGHILLAFFALFALSGSIQNGIRSHSGTVNFPAILTHAGFAVFIVGIVMTFSNSRIISANTSGHDLGDPRTNAENLILVRGDTLPMSGFYTVYSGKIRNGNLTTYKIDFLKLKAGNYKREFSLYPSINTHPAMGAVHNPDTRHFLWKDYYTYISFAGEDPDYVVIRSIENPWINILWVGAILLVAGPAWAFNRRLKRRQHQ